MIVTDVNNIVYLLTDSPKRESAVLLRKIDGDWRVPALWKHEMLNVIATLTRGKQIEVADSYVLWNNAIKMFAPKEHNPNLVNALTLAIEKNISAYDAQYITLAKELGVYCVTEDTRLLKKFPDLTISMKKFRDA